MSVDTMKKEELNRQERNFKARDKAKEQKNKMSFYVLDTETTGHHK